MRMKPGIFVGHHERTGTHILLTPTGVERGVGLHPLPQDKRWDLEFLKTCKGLPWEMRPGRRTTPQPTFAEEEKEMRAPSPAVVPVVTTTVARKFYVVKGDAQRYGATDGCPGCTAVFLGGRTEVPHTVECRARIFKCYAEDEDPKQKVRYTRYLQRHNELDGRSRGRHHI